MFMDTMATKGIMSVIIVSMLFRYMIKYVVPWYWYTHSDLLFTHWENRNSIGPRVGDVYHHGYQP